MTSGWRQGSLGMLKGGLPDLARDRLIGAGAEEKEHGEHEQWRFVLEEGSSSATVVLYRTGTCVRAGRGPAADSLEDLVLQIINEEEIQQAMNEPVTPSRKKQKWYAIAEPIRGVFNDLEECKRDLAGVPGLRRGPVRVSSSEEGWTTLNGGVRLDPGLYAFTDASGTGGIGIVIVEMLAHESEPVCLDEIPSSVVQATARRLVKGVDSAGSRDAFRRHKHIYGEILALRLALQEVLRFPNAFEWPSVTIVHDYIGVSAWMRAVAPEGASFQILPGFTDAAEVAETWGPPDGETAELKVVEACWRFAADNKLFLKFRHQPGHRSEAAGVNHFVRFNRRADKLAVAAKL